MKAIARLQYLRMAPRKVRMVADLVRGKNAVEAKTLLQFAAKHSALPVLKTLNSAIASAKNNFQAEESNLYISHISINEGPKLKRYRPRAKGQAFQIQKKTSHIRIVLDEIKEGSIKAKTTKAKNEKPVVETTSKKNTTAKPKFTLDKGLARPKEQRSMAQRMFRRKSI